LTTPLQKIANERQVCQFTENQPSGAEAECLSRQATAAELDINRTTLYKKMRKYQLDQGGIA
jgi:DNA-binding NtrC family response regulator